MPTARPSSPTASLVLRRSGHAASGVARAYMRAATTDDGSSRRITETPGASRTRKALVTRLSRLAARAGEDALTAIRPTALNTGATCLARSARATSPESSLLGKTALVPEMIHCTLTTSPRAKG